MKDLLYLISIIFLSASIQSCQSQKASEKEVSKDAVSADTTATSIDTVAVAGDTLTASTSSTVDTTDSKDDKYNSNTTEKHEAPDHKTPDQAKLDSIKNAKKKKKG